MKYAHLAWYALILFAIFGLAKPGSRAGRAVTAVSGALAGALGQGLAGAAA
jgi:hypothetical protein